MTESHATMDVQYDDDFAAHEHTYKAFLRGIKFCVVGVIVLLVLIAWIWL